MKKLFNIITLTTLINLNFIQAQQQQEIPCTPLNFNLYEDINFDSLKRGPLIVLRNKSKGDMPYYEENRFTKPKNITHFVAIASNSEAFGYDIQKIDGSPLKHTIINQNPYKLLRIDDDFSGYYNVIVYSKQPDNQCIYVHQLLLKEQWKKIQYPVTEIMGIKNKGKLELLKTYELEKSRKQEIPVFKEYTYVFTKGKQYLFEIKDAPDLRIRLENVNKESLKPTVIEGNNYLFNCKATGVYYFTIYQNEGLERPASVNLFVDR